MRIKSIILYSNNLVEQKAFYRDVLGFELLNESSNSFSMRIGWSVLTFKLSAEKYLYHYCFLIPSNKLNEAFEWFDKRLNIIKLDNETIFDFESWNAKSFYFYDGNGNVAECIVRYDLQNSTTDKFSLEDLLCVNEIGTPTSQIADINQKIEAITGSLFWKGDKTRFGTNGNNEGLFLLVNNEIKKEWYPTTIPTQSSPYNVIFETVNGEFKISYANQNMDLQRKSYLDT